MPVLRCLKSSKLERIPSNTTRSYSCGGYYLCSKAYVRVKFCSTKNLIKNRMWSTASTFHSKVKARQDVKGVILCMGVCVCVYNIFCVCSYNFVFISWLCVVCLWLKFKKQKLKKKVGIVENSPAARTISIFLCLIIRRVARHVDAFHQIEFRVRFSCFSFLFVFRFLVVFRLIFILFIKNLVFNLFKIKLVCNISKCSKSAV